jgi:cytochrome c553
MIAQVTSAGKVDNMQTLTNTTIVIVLLLFAIVIFTNKALALENMDPYSSVRTTWITCTACHGATGLGGVGPTLIGKDAEHLAQELKIYKSLGTVGPQSQMMWGFAELLSDEQIVTISEYIANGFPDRNINKIK